jgi:hypothetical protein
MENETKESLADLYVGQLVRIAHLEAENAALQTQLAGMKPTKFDELMLDPEFRNIYAAECAKGDMEQLKSQVQRLSAPVSAPVTTEVAAKCGNRIYVGTTGESSCEQPLGHSGSHRQGKFEWAAYGFTVEREKEIRQVEEEMLLLRSMVILLDSEPGDLTAPIYKRTLARLQAALAELKKGMKP